VLAESIAKIGENISIRRAVRYTADKQGVIGSYVHSTGRQGALVELATANEAAANNPEVASLAKELAMQVVAVKPEYITRENVPAEVLEKEKEIYREELRAANKPEAIWEKILTGKLEKFFSEKNLVDQIWVKDDKKKIKNLLDEVSKKVGGPVVIKRMSRFEVGEGVEKKKEDLAAEVAATLGTTKS
jgi:elongation factor Ts